MSQDETETFKNTSRDRLETETFETETTYLVSKHDKISLDFTLTKSFMKLFHTGSINIANECQAHFNFLPVHYLIDTRIMRFLQQFIITSSNQVCMLFFNNAVNIVNNLFSFYNVTSCAILLMNNSIIGANYYCEAQSQACVPI